MDTQKSYEHQYIETHALKPYKNNARHHSTKQIEQIAASIQEFGFTNPILIDDAHLIIAGHGRHSAALKLGIVQVPCIILKGLSDQQKKAYLLADNKIALNAKWDDDKLFNEILHLQQNDFDLSILGFSDKEILEILQDNAVSVGLIDEDDCPEVSENPISKIGDLWILGNHRLLCGDSTDPNNIEKLLGGEKAQMCFTDPPYLMNFTGSMKGDGSKSFNSKHGGIKNDKMSISDGDQFLDKINLMIKNYVVGAFYISFYRLGIDRYFKSLERVGLKWRNLIIWDKTAMTLSNSDYKSFYEPIFYGSTIAEKNADYDKGYEPIFYGWVKDHNFFGGKNGVDIWRVARTARNDLHPTMKPVELVERAIIDATQRNDRILDLFGGSGTTLIAAEKNQRHAFLMELDLKYADVIIKRYQEFTGQSAIHAHSGIAFNEIQRDDDVG